VKISREPPNIWERLKRWGHGKVYDWRLRRYVQVRLLPGSAEDLILNQKMTREKGRKMIGKRAKSTKEKVILMIVVLPVIQIAVIREKTGKSIRTTRKRKKRRIKLRTGRRRGRGRERKVAAIPAAIRKAAILKGRERDERRKKRRKKRKRIRRRRKGRRKNIRKTRNTRRKKSIRRTRINQNMDMDILAFLIYQICTENKKNFIYGFKKSEIYLLIPSLNPI